MQQCQELIDKVRELRYLKVGERQINKFNRLLQKERNTTWFKHPPTLSQGVGQTVAGLTHSQEGVQAALNCRQARVSVPVMVYEGLQWEMSLLPQTIH